MDGSKNKSSKSDTVDKKLDGKSKSSKSDTVDKKHDGTSKSSKYDTMDKKFVGSSVGLNLGQTSQDFCGASKSLEDNESFCSMTSCRATCAGEDPDVREYMNMLLDSYHGDRKAMVSDLVKTIGDLEEQVKEHKRWAQETVTRAENSVEETQKQLNMLRIEIDERKRENEKKAMENACNNLRLMEMEQSVEAAWTEACHRIDKCKRLECENNTIKAKIEAFKQNLAESEKGVKKAKKGEKRKLRKAKEVEKQNRSLEAQCDAEEQKVLQLQLELSQVEKDAEEAEAKWRRALHEKEQMLIVLSEEREEMEIQRANSRAQLSQLRQTCEIDRQQAEDELRRLKTDYSCLKLSLQVGDLMLYDSPEAVAFTNRAFQESVEERYRCLICQLNEVSMVFLPCAHEVVCHHCHEHKFNLEPKLCPYCHVEIEQAIRVRGRNS